jgi:hypothetical protein
MPAIEAAAKAYHAAFNRMQEANQCQG